MNSPSKHAVGGILAVLLASAAALPANASYLGYGNGDPGDWDLWQEQNGGKPLPSEAQQKEMAQRHLYYDTFTGSYDGPQHEHHAVRHAHRLEPKRG